MSSRYYYGLALLSLGWLLIAKNQQRFARRHPHQFIRHKQCEKLNPGPATIFVHGTTFAGLSRLLFHNPKRSGLFRYTFGPAQGRKRLAQVLHEAAPKEFPGESFYKYYWNGHLTMEDRQHAAENLQRYLKGHPGPITLIAHSHGCNVALYLAELAKKDSSLSIDRLILLAPPVQQATKELVRSSCFKKVYSFYSTGDLMQVADPQGIYQGLKSGTFFSERTYPKAPHLIQARVLVHGQSPGHRDFIMPTFFKHLPQLITVLDEAHKNGQDTIMVTIPSLSAQPYPIDKTTQGNYTPYRIHDHEGRLQAP